MKLIDYIFTYVYNELNLKIDKNLTIQNKFDYLDKIIHSTNYELKKKYQIQKIFYKIFLYLKSNPNYKFIYPNDFYELFVNNKYFGTYEIDLIRIMNCGNNDIDIVISSSTLNNEDIKLLKKFYEKQEKI